MEFLTWPTWMTESLWTKPSSSSSSESSSQAESVMVGKSEEEPDWNINQPQSLLLIVWFSSHLFKPLLPLLKFISEGLWCGGSYQSLSVRNLNIQTCRGLNMITGSQGLSLLTPGLTSVLLLPRDFDSLPRGGRERTFFFALFPITILV